MLVDMDQLIIIVVRLLLKDLLLHLGGIVQIMEICGDELTLVHLIHLGSDRVQRDIMCQAISSGKLCMISYVDLQVVTCQYY